MPRLSELQLLNQSFWGGTQAAVAFTVPPMKTVMAARLRKTALDQHSGFQSGVPEPSASPGKMHSIAFCPQIFWIRRGWAQHSVFSQSSQRILLPASWRATAPELGFIHCSVPANHPAFGPGCGYRLVWSGLGPELLNWWCDATGALIMLEEPGSCLQRPRLCAAGLPEVFINMQIPWPCFRHAEC